MKKLYIKLENNKKPRTIRDFLKYFYSCYEYPYFFKGFDTYSDSNYTIKQCNKNWRSFDDLYVLVKTYYPSITINKFINILLTTKFTKKDGELMYPHLGYCEGMGRIRFIPHSGINKTLRSYIDHRCKSKDSNYNWTDLLSKVKDLKNFESNTIKEFYLKNAK